MFLLQKRSCSQVQGGQERHCRIRPLQSARGCQPKRDLRGTDAMFEHGTACLLCRGLSMRCQHLQRLTMVSAGACRQNDKRWHVT